MLIDYNLWPPFSSSKNAIVIEHVFTDVAVVFPKLSVVSHARACMQRCTMPQAWVVFTLHQIPPQQSFVFTSKGRNTSDATRQRGAIFLFFKSKQIGLQHKTLVYI